MKREKEHLGVLGMHYQLSADRLISALGHTDLFPGWSTERLSATLGLCQHVFKFECFKSSIRSTVVADIRFL